MFRSIDQFTSLPFSEGFLSGSIDHFWADLEGDGTQKRNKYLSRRFMELLA
jgi:hypothetical protein